MKIQLKQEEVLFNKYYLIVISVLFYFHFALRASTIGNDTGGYIELYQTLQETRYPDMIFLFTRYEVGYLFFSKIIADIFTSPQFLFVISGLIIIPSYSLFIYKYSKLIWLSVFLYFVLRYFDSNMNILRQALAMCFIFYSYSFVRKKRLLPFLLCVFCAFLFHKSAIVFVLAWLINYIRINRLTIPIFLAGVVVTFIVSPYVINILFANGIVHNYYADSEYLESGKLAPLLNLIIALIVFFFAFYSASHKIASDKETETLIYDNKNMLILQMFAVYLLIFSMYFTVLGRVAMYFEVFSIILLPNSVRCIRNKNLYLLTIAAIIVLFTIYYFVIVTYRPDWNRVYPYEFYNMF